MTIQTHNAKTIPLSDVAIFFTVGWMFLALVLSPVFGVNWQQPGDFSYSTAMYYHGLMVPLLILLYLLTRNFFPLPIVNTRIYTVDAMLSVLFVGAGSILNNSTGVSVATVIQILGMMMTDSLGIILLVAMVIFAIKEKGNSRTTGTAFWLVFSSIISILIAAPLGHLAGSCIDLGAQSVPGVNILLRATQLKPDAFREGLVASHSHLLMAALLCGLAAVTAIYFQYQSRTNWRKWIRLMGLWTILLSLLSATGIYFLSAMTGWEPSVIFASGPNGIPLDDVVLSVMEIGFLMLMLGISGALVNAHAEPVSPVKSNVRTSIYVNWICGFLSVVLPGIYIELNEGFYGAGIPPASGALNDNIFIRAHLIYPFLLLPIIFSVALAVGRKYEYTTARRFWPTLFIRTSVLGMLLGLVGEIAWFATQRTTVFVVAVFIMGFALAAGMISLWPRAGMKDNHPDV